jgi:environmental stress-induced protein Ves
LTREVAAHPPGSDLASFEWRVSMAELRTGGPFSHFPDIDRSLAVLDGSLTLTISGGAPVTLSPDTPPVHFPGDVTVTATPLSGVVTDLNAMVRRGRWRSCMSRVVGRGFASLRFGEGSALLIAITPLAVRSGASGHELVRLDAALLEGPAACEVQSVEMPGALWLIELTSRTSR